MKPTAKSNIRLIQRRKTMTNEMYIVGLFGSNQQKTQRQPSWSVHDTWIGGVDQIWRSSTSWTDTFSQTFCIALNVEKILHNLLIFQRANPNFDVINLHIYWVALCRLNCGAASRQQKKTNSILRLIMGLEISWKNLFVLNPVQRPRINWTKTNGFRVFVLSLTREMYPLRSANFFGILNLGSEARFVLSQPGGLCPPRMAGAYISTPGFKLIFFCPKSRGAFCALDLGPKSI